MRTVVCVPYRPADEQRVRNWDYVRAWWEGWEVYTGDSGTEAFSCGSSRNRASEAAGDWDVAIFTDADVVPGSHAQMLTAINTAKVTGSFVIAYSELRYLAPLETERVCAGHVDLGKAKIKRAIGQTWINTFAIRRDLWDQVRGFDERFVGYGPEDIAFYKAAATLGGAERNPGPLYHLDHPERPEPPNRENWSLVNEYGYASWDEGLMRKVIAERHS